jgi:hypothetical protein
MSLPDTFVVGAAKCGTTSIYQYFLNHSQIFAPREIKELGYFAHTGRIRSLAEYESYFAGPEAARARRRADVSTAYLYWPTAAHEIYQHCGADVRIIAFLRNPAAAAVSLWQHQLRHGFEDLDLEDALRAEPARQAKPDGLKDWAPNYFYLDRYRYAPQLRRYLDRFGRDRVRVYVFEQFFADIASGWRDLCAFLEVDDTEVPANLGREYNVGGEERSKWLAYLITRRFPLRHALAQAIPYRFRERLLLALKDWNKRPGAAAIDGAIMDVLSKAFAADIAETSALLDIDLAALWPQRAEDGRAA